MKKPKVPKRLMLRRREKVDPNKLLEDCMILLQQHILNLQIKAGGNNTELSMSEVKSIQETIKSLMTVADVKIKQIELEARIKALHKNSAAQLTDSQLKKEILMELTNDKQLKGDVKKLLKMMKGKINK